MYLSSSQVDKEQPKARSDSNWLRDQGLQLLVVITSSLTAACYLVGRAGLLGWYEAAGVPILSFSWSFQDVVIRGMTDAKTWLLVAVSVIGLALYLMALDMASGRFSKASDAWSRFRARGESLDGLGLRKRWAWEARLARRGHLASAEASSLRWRVLGKRGANRVHSKAFAKNLSKPSSVIVGGIAVLWLLLITLGLYVAGAVLLVQHPYNIGAQSFREQYFAATDREAPARHYVAWKSKGYRPVRTSAMAASRGRTQLSGYPYIQLFYREGDSAEKRLCGWLVQASGGVVLMLTSEGLVMKNFGDGAFQWKTESPDSCDGTIAAQSSVGTR